MEMRKLCVHLLVGALLAGMVPAASATVVFQNTPDNGWFVPLSSANAGDVLYGDSGWLGTDEPSYTLTRIELGLVSQNGLSDGTTDIEFTLNDGDPSGLVFGPGTELWSTTITNVPLIASANPNYFTLSIDLPNIVTSGGFNNIGWSIGVNNFNFDGGFGFQCSTASGQSVGFYTNNASFYNGSNWSLFSFGPDSNTGVANFVATIHAVPEPATAGILALGAMLTLVRARRRAK